MEKAYSIQFNNLNINSIQRASGVFFGHNSQWGWSAHGKQNTGFGSITGRDNILLKNKSTVYDNDLNDSLIDDRDVMIGDSLEGNGADVIVDLEAMNVNAMQSDAGIFSGQNQQFGWSSHEKQNNNTIVKGHFNKNNSNDNIVIDNDYIDTPIFDQDFKVGFGSQRG